MGKLRLGRIHWLLLLDKWLSLSMSSLQLLCPGTLTPENSFQDPSGAARPLWGRGQGLGWLPESFTLIPLTVDPR